jgi:hypothetical protein
MSCSFAAAALDTTRLFSVEHEHRAHDDFFAVHGGGAGAKLGPPRHLGHVIHRHGHALAGRHADTADVLKTRHLAGHAHQVLVAEALDVAGADVGVVALQRRKQVGQRQALRQQRLRARRHHHLLFRAANEVDLGDAGYLEQLWADDPVHHRMQVDRVVGAAVRGARALSGAQDEHEDFAQPGGDRTHLRLQAWRQAASDLLQALGDARAGEVDVGAVGEHHRDLRQAVARQ